MEEHLNAQSTPQLQLAVLSEVGLLPERLRPSALRFVDAVNTIFAHDQRFWQLTSCFQAATAVWVVAATMYDDEEVTATVAQPLAMRRHQLAFGLFQIPTLSFAYSASTQRRQRQFMGIRKGIFG